MVHIALCAVISCAVAFGFYSASLNWFVVHKSEEKVTALKLVDAFVTNYSALRTQLGGDAPVPSSFRAHSIEGFNALVGADNAMQIRWVGRPGHQIKTGPTDAAMADAIEAFARQSDPPPTSSFLSVNGQSVFRTVYPSYAREESCVACHNRLQPNAHWRVGDLMGAFAIDAPAAAFMHDDLVTSVEFGLGVFATLALAGLYVALLNYRHFATREAASVQVARAKEFLKRIIDNIPAAVMVKDMVGGRVVVANKSVKDLVGLSGQDLVGRTLDEAAPGETADFMRARDEEVVRRGGAMQVFEHDVAGNEGARAYVTRKLLVPGEREGSLFMLTLSQDVSKRKQAEAHIAFISKHDPLTRLPNRVAFTERLGAAIDDARRDSRRIALVVVDLDRFKEVNDTFGHVAGDEFLRIAAVRLQDAASGAFICRLDGDEFALILIEAPDAAEELASRLHASFGDDAVIAGQRLTASLSVGVAFFPENGEDAEALYGHADAALYRAKSDGRACTRYYDTETDARLRERRALRREMVRALSHNEFSLEYQPQAKMDGEVVGMEALIRWRHPARGQIPPGAFIPIAEESGFIAQIGDWTLREACREAAQWRSPLIVAVNVSPVQFRHDGLPELVLSILLETGLSARRLELEITEGALVEDFDRAIKILRRLKGLGVRIAMDDFGTGYSSLSYLHAFPFDKIKIDRSFIADVRTNPQSQAIVRGMIGLARGLNLPVTAEGVETEEQLAFLKRESCDCAQGYLLGRPRPIADYAEIVGAAGRLKMAQMA